MFLLGQALRTERVRIDALRGLYRQSLADNESEARGLRLLRHWLSPSQRAQFDDLGYFEVVGCDSVEDDTGSVTDQRQTFARSTMLAVSTWVGVSCLLAI
jgi:hypothetical protein